MLCNITHFYSRLKAYVNEQCLMHVRLTQYIPLFLLLQGRTLIDLSISVSLGSHPHQPVSI